MALQQYMITSAVPGDKEFSELTTLWWAEDYDHAIEQWSDDRVSGELVIDIKATGCS